MGGISLTSAEESCAIYFFSSVYAAVVAIYNNLPMRIWGANGTRI